MSKEVADFFERLLNELTHDARFQKGGIHIDHKELGSQQVWTVRITDWMESTNDLIIAYEPTSHQWGYGGAFSKDFTLYEKTNEQGALAFVQLMIEKSAVQRIERIRAFPDDARAYLAKHPAGFTAVEKDIVRDIIERAA